jgi:hypothetical protein
MQKIVLTAAQRESLIRSISDSIYSANEDFGIGEMGEIGDEAARIVDEWAEDNNIIFE